MKKIAIIGSVGVPSNYGGFETLVDNIIGDKISNDIQYTVFCSAKHYYERPRHYKGAILKYVKINANGAQSILYDSVSLIRAIKGYDTVVLLGVSGGIFLPIFKLFSRAKLITNIDGLEWKRNKWNTFAKFFLRISEWFALRYSNIIIADNQVIVDYIKPRYKDKTVLIAYGGDHVTRNVTKAKITKTLNRYKLTPQGYAISVGRIEPENNYDLILSTFAKSDTILAVVGNWGISKYSIALKNKYKQYKHLVFIDATYDLDMLYILRSNAKHYVHGHSAGGTNPSLIEAMFCGCNILCFDINFNRQSTLNCAHYFKDDCELLHLISKADNNSEKMLEIAQMKYCWKTIAEKYESLY